MPDTLRQRCGLAPSRAPDCGAVPLVPGRGDGAAGSSRLREQATAPGQRAPGTRRGDRRSTILTRNHAGNLSDRVSSKSCMVRGLRLRSLASLIRPASAWTVSPPPASYILLLAGRLLFGLGESQVLQGHEAGPSDTLWMGVS
jgi:hypothetical protein